MPRKMSFAMTTQQVREGTKDVTRRLGWWNLKPGEIVDACVKCMGLKKGEKVEILRQIRIVSIRSEHLNEITKAEIIREGFPDMSREEFITFFMKGHKCFHGVLTTVNRIEFEYVKDPQ